MYVTTEHAHCELRNVINILRTSPQLLFKVSCTPSCMDSCFLNYSWWFEGSSHWNSKHLSVEWYHTIHTYLQS